MPKKLFRLSDAEISHIYQLLTERQLDGSYYGKKDDYYKRNGNLLAFFGNLLKEVE